MRKFTSFLWPFSIAMLNYQRDPEGTSRTSGAKICGYKPTRDKKKGGGLNMFEHG